MERAITEVGADGDDVSRSLVVGNLDGLIRRQSYNFRQGGMGETPKNSVHINNCGVHGGELVLVQGGESLTGKGGCKGMSFHLFITDNQIEGSTVKSHSK